MYFSEANVELMAVAPVGVAFGISLVCSMAGISGAFLLLPWQTHVLGYVQPGVSATNHIFNIFACPAGVWRYAREGRLLIPLALFIAAGTLPGVFLGAVIRLKYLADQRHFMLFVSAFLIYIGFNVILASRRRKKAATGSQQSSADKCQVISWSIKGFRFLWQEKNHDVAAMPIMLLSLVVGLLGGVYGVGGGAIMSPFLVSFFGMPVRAIAGATLFATFLTSLAGTAFYSLLACIWAYPEARPDWPLGILLGIGGILGMYCGAALQKYMSDRILRAIIVAAIFLVALNGIIKFAQL